MPHHNNRIGAPSCHAAPRKSAPYFQKNCKPVLFHPDQTGGRDRMRTATLARRGKSGPRFYRPTGADGGKLSR